MEISLSCNEIKLLLHEEVNDVLNLKTQYATQTC